MLFERLFNFLGDDLKRAERRMASRYVIAATFPLTTSLVTPAGEFPGKVVDMSAGGIGLLLPQAPGAETGASVRVNFDLAGTRFSSGANLRQSRAGADGVHCGIEVGLDDVAGRKAYLLLLMPVSIGATLAPAPPTRSPIPEPNLERMAFAGESGSRLTVWCRTDPAKSPESFEFQVDDYFVRGHGSDPVIRAFSLVDDDRPHRAKETAPLFKSNSRLEHEICQLFTWSVLNIAGNVPPAIRQFLATFRAT